MSKNLAFFMSYEFSNNYSPPPLYNKIVKFLRFSLKLANLKFIKKTTAKIKTGIFFKAGLCSENFNCFKKR